MNNEILKRARAKDSFAYMLLGRMKSDCLYFLGNGGRCAKYLWSNSVERHIADMKALWTAFPVDGKPEWLSLKDIEHFEERMVVA